MKVNRTEDEIIMALMLHRDSTNMFVKNNLKDVISKLVQEFCGTHEVSLSELKEIYEFDGKIAAIKLHRNRTGSGLKVSKDLVEKMAKDHDWKKPDYYRG